MIYSSTQPPKAEHVHLSWKRGKMSPCGSVNFCVGWSPSWLFNLGNLCGFGATRTDRIKITRQLNINLCLLRISNQLDLFMFALLFFTFKLAHLASCQAAAETFIFSVKVPHKKG